MNITAGKTYRLRRDFEVRDEKTGTMRHYLRKGTVVTVRKVAADEEHVWVDGVAQPLYLDAFERTVEPA